MKTLRNAALVAATLALAACGKGGNDSANSGQGTSKQGQVEGGDKAAAPAAAKRERKEKNPRIFIRSLGEPEYLDPGLMSESEGGIVARDTFEGLYQYGPTEKEWPAGVAERHEVSEDGKTWTFHLRKDAKWSDGVPVTAHDFEYAWKRVLDPVTASRYASIMWFLEGAKAYSESSEAERAAKRDAVGVKAVDDHTLEVKLVAPTPFFIQLTAFYSYSPVPKHVIEKHGDKWARPENIVSNGPWKVVEWTSHQQIVAELNQHYWDKDKLPFDKIIYRITQEQDPAHNMYVAGETDYLDSKVPTSMLPQYRKQKAPDLIQSPYLGVYYYLFNVKQPPFDNLKVRQALNLAVDKEAIGSKVAKGGQEEAWSIVHPGLASVGYKAPKAPDYDPDKAKKLLAEAGYPEGKGFPRFKISYNTLEAHKQIAEYVQQEWKKNLGIDCDLDNMEWKVLLKKHQEKDFQVSRAAWIGDYIDPLTFLELWEGDNSNNHTNWDNDQFDSLITQARQEADPAKRFELLSQAEAVFIEELPALPIYFYVKTDMVQPWLKGYQSHLQGIHGARYFKVEL